MLSSHSLATFHDTEDALSHGNELSSARSHIAYSPMMSQRTALRFYKAALAWVTPVLPREEKYRTVVPCYDELHYAGPGPSYSSIYINEL